MGSYMSVSSAAKSRHECIQLEMSERFQAIQRLMGEIEEQWNRWHTLNAMLLVMKPFPDPEQQPTESSDESTESFETEQRECPPTPARRKCDEATWHGLLSTNLLPNGTRIWKCYCNLEFKTYEKMKFHFLKKTQRKLLRCSECWKRFHLGYQLKAHRKRVHGLPTYSCSMCFVQFENEEEYNQHLAASLFESDCSAKLREKRRKHEPFFTPLREGTYGLLSVRHAPENYDDYDYDNNLYGIKSCINKL